MHEKVVKEEQNYVGCIHDSNFIRMFWLGEGICRFLRLADQTKRKIGGKQNGYDCFRCYDCRSWDLSSVCIDKSRKIVRIW